MPRQRIPVHALTTASLILFALVLWPAEVHTCNPTQLIAQAGEMIVRLFWAHDPDAPASFDILRRPATGGAFAKVGTTTDTQFTDVLVGLPAIAYEFIVVAHHDGVPYRSASVVATPTDGPPPEPVDLAIGFSPNLYSFTWALPSPPPDLAGFWVVQRHTPSQPWTRVNAKLLPPDRRVFLGSKPQNKLHISVIAVDRSGHQTQAANEVTANPGEFQQTELHSHHTPYSLVAEGLECAASLTWQQAGGSSRVYMSLSSDSGYELIAECSEYAYVATGLTPGVYYFRVSGIDHDPPEESPVSNTASAVVVDTPPPAPTDLTVSNNVELYSLRFNLPNPPADLVGFDVWRSWTAGGPYVKANEAPLPPGDAGFFQAAIPRAPLYLKASSRDATHETLSTEEVCVLPSVLIAQEPKLNPTYFGGAGSVTPTGEFISGGT